MTFALLALLALVQGITEFLPVSSSAHLVLTRLAWGEAGGGANMLVLDVALHVGTLFAVIVYFRNDATALIRGGFGLIAGKREGDARLAWLLLVATIPAILAGALLKGLITDHLRGVEIIAWTTLIFGLALGWADRLPAAKCTLDLGWKGALAIGVAQAFALVPGVSRSGIAMTAARALKLSREEAARFALLLAIPTIAGAGAVAGLALQQAGNAALGTDAALGAALSFIAAYGAIWLMMRWLKRASFMPFVIYRMGLGLLLLMVAYG